MAGLLVEEVVVLQPKGGLWRESDGQLCGVAVDHDPDSGGDQMPEHSIALGCLPSQQSDAEDHLEGVVLLGEPPRDSSQLVVQLALGPSGAFPLGPSAPVRKPRRVRAENVGCLLTPDRSRDESGNTVLVGSPELARSFLSQGRIWPGLRRAKHRGQPIP